MPLILLLRFWLSVASLAILAGAAYLLWSWHEGDVVRDVHGVLHLEHHGWRLWTGIALGIWSFGGGNLVLRPFLARRDRTPYAAPRGDGRLIDGVHGAKLYVEAYGSVDKPCLVLTHGWGLDSTIWATTRHELADRFRVIVWDLPSMGKSKAPNSAVTLEHFADNLERIVDYTGAAKVVLVSHSIGGMATQTLARDKPRFFQERIAGVVLLNTTYQNPLTTMIMNGVAQALRFPVIEPQFFLTMILWPLAWIGGWKSYLDGSAHLANRFGFGPNVTHGQLEHTTLLSIRNSPGAQAKGNLAMFRWNADGALRQTSVPVLVIAGRDDIVTQPRAGRHIADQLPGAEFLLVNKANHMGFLERAEVYSPAIARFALACFEAPASIKDALER